MGTGTSSSILYDGAPDSSGKKKASSLGVGISLPQEGSIKVYTPLHSETRLSIGEGAIINTGDGAIDASADWKTSSLGAGIFSSHISSGEGMS